MTIKTKGVVKGSVKKKGTVVGSASVGKPLAKLTVETIEGGHRITITDPSGVQSLDIMDGKDGVITTAVINELLGYTPLKSVKLNGNVLKAGDDNVVDLGTLAVLVDGLIKASELPLVSDEMRGAISPQDKTKLDGMVSAAPYFEEVGTGTLNYKEDTRGLETYDSCYKASDATPTYEELLNGTTASYQYTDPSGPYVATMTPDILYNEAGGYCTISKAGARVGYVIYEENTLGVSAGTYFNRNTRSMTVEGYTGYDTKLILKEEYLPDDIGGNVSEEDVQQAVNDALAFMQIVRGIKANGTSFSINEAGDVDLGNMVQSNGTGGEPPKAHLKLQAGSESYSVPVVRGDGTIGAALLPVADEYTSGTITAELFNKLAGIEDGAEKNVVTAVTYRNHGGSGAIGYIFTDADGTEFMVPRMGWETLDGIECIYHGVLPDATQYRKGAMSAAHYKKLEGIAEGATKVTAPADIGAETFGTAEALINSHNTSGAAHNDIRLLVEGLTTRLNALANSDDTTLDQMAEVVAYIKSNRTLIESVTTDKVNVADIIDNLTTNVSNKPLAASQGVALKSLYDALATKVDGIKVPAKLSELTGDSTHRTVTDTEKDAWSSKLDQSDLQGAAEDILTQAKASGEFDGADGQRGTGTLKVTTAPSSYTTAIGDYTPKYRIAVSTVKSQSKVSEVLVGDTLEYSYYHYAVDRIEGDYAYISVSRQSIRGAAGAAGSTPVKGTDYFTDADKEEMVQQVLAAIPVITDMTVEMIARGDEW